MADRDSAGPQAWKTVLTHVEASPACVPRLKAAVELARRFDALLIGLGALTVEPSAIADPYGFAGVDAQALTALRESAQKELLHAERLFGEHAQGVRAEWRAIDGRPTPTLARTARAADVIVAGGRLADRVDGHRTIDAAEVTLASGRPVLVAPADGSALQARRAVVAWKDSRESRGAVADALPLLAETEQVLVVEVCGKTDHDDALFRAEDVAANLRRHGLEARATAIVASDAEVANVLDSEAQAIGADLIVAGCYGRSRMNEWLFGGATLDLLRDPARYLLMSH